MASVTLKIIAGTKDIKGKKVTISGTKEPGQIKTQVGLKPAKKKQLEFVEWGYQKGRSAGKAAGGAIIGGVLTGGLGAIAGAAVGGRKRDNSTAVLTLDGNQKLYVKCGPKDYEKLVGMLP